MKETRNIAAAFAALTLSVAAFARSDGSFRQVQGPQKPVAEPTEATKCITGASTGSATGKESVTGKSPAAGRDLYDEFVNPPKSARPRV